MTAAERRHYSRLAVLGCIACRQLGYLSAAEIHHIRAGTGMGKKSRDAIPLCPAHHRGLDHPRTPSIHLDKRKFIEAFGTEAELLETVNDLLAGQSQLRENTAST
jgi:uncharacterized protein YbbK (DUF523 family)